MISLRLSAFISKNIHLTLQRLQLYHLQVSTGPLELYTTVSIQHRPDNQLKSTPVSQGKYSAAPSYGQFICFLALARSEDLPFVS